MVASARAPFLVLDLNPMLQVKHTLQQLSRSQVPCCLDRLIANSSQIRKLDTLLIDGSQLVLKVKEVAEHGALHLGRWTGLSTTWFKSAGARS
jgi:hypothetical protein